MAPVLEDIPRDLDQRQLDRRFVDRVGVVRRSRERQRLRAKHDDHVLLLIVSALGHQKIGPVAARRGGARQSGGRSAGEGRLEGRTLTRERAVLELRTRQRAGGRAAR